MVTCVVWVGAARRLPADALRKWPLHLPIGQRAAIWSLVLACFALAAAPLAAAEPSSKPSSTAHSVRDEAIRSIPFDKLPAETRSKVSAVIEDVSLYRRLPTESIDCEPDLFRFLVNNPDVLVNIWRVMGVSSVTLDRVDTDQFRCSDGDGTTAHVEVVFRNPQMQVIYAEGLYDGPLFPRPVRGQCVAVLQYASVRKSSGRYEETAHLDTFLHVDNVGVELLAKLFQGLVGRTIDHNFVETVSFIGSVSRTAEINPKGIRRLAARLDHVTPERRDQFASVTDRVSTKLADVKLTSDDEDHPALADVLEPSTVETPPPGGRR